MPPTRAVDLIAHRFAADLVGGFETVPPYLSNIPQNLFTKADVHQVPFIALAYGMLSVRRATRDRVRNSKDLSSVLEPKTQEHHTEQKSADALNPSMVDEGQGRELKQKGKAKESNESSLAAVVGSSVDKVANEATEKVQGQDYVEAVAAETKKRVGQSDGTDDGQNLNRTFTDREGIQCPYHGAGYALGGGEFEVHFNPPRDDPYVLELIERTKIRFERGRTPSNWGLDSTKDPLPQKKKRNKRRKAPQPESGNIDIEEGKDIAGASNGKLKAGDRNSGQPLFGRGKPATSAIDTVQKGDKTAIARSQLTTMASASSTSDAPTVNSAVCRQSDIPTTVGEGAGSSSSRGSSSADNIKAIKRKSVGSGSKAGKRKSGVSQGGSSGGGGQERSIGDSGDPGDKDKGKGKATAVDPRNAARKEKMEKEGLIAFKVGSICGVM